MSTTLLVMCWLRSAGVSRGGHAGRGRLGSFGCLCRLCGLGLGRLGSSLSARVSGAVRGASRDASLRLESRATTAAALHRGWVLKS